MMPETVKNETEIKRLKKIAELAMKVDTATQSMDALVNELATALHGKASLVICDLTKLRNSADDISKKEFSIATLGYKFKEIEGIEAGQGELSNLKHFLLGAIMVGKEIEEIKKVLIDIDD